MSVGSSEKKTYQQHIFRSYPTTGVLNEGPLLRQDFLVVGLSLSLLPVVVPVTTGPSRTGE